MKNKIDKSFISDNEKMIDYFMLSKNEFLKFYSYLTEEEYDETTKKVQENSINKK